MLTNADTPSDGLADIYFTWLNNLGVTATSRGLGEMLSLIADNQAATASAQGNTDFAPTNTIAANMSRLDVASSTLAVASGTLQVASMYLSKGMVVNNINWISGTTAGATLNHQWGVIASSAATPVVLANTAPDLTSAAIGANTVISYPISPAYTVPSSGIYYVGVMVSNNSGTQPTFSGFTATSNVAIQTVPPIISGTSNTGASTIVAVGANLTTITPTLLNIYLYLT